MPHYVYIYVGQSAFTNFTIGMEHLVWGWKSDSYGPDVAQAMAVLRNPRASVRIVFARGLEVTNPPRGWPRTPAGDRAWDRASLKEVVLAKVARPLYEDHTPVWPDDTYPVRVSLESVIPLPVLTIADMVPGVAPVLRDAALRRGMPMLGPAPVAEDHFLDIEDDGESDPDHLSSDLDNLDGVTRSLVRREHKQLRDLVFGDALSKECALCHRLLPVALLRLAHIKRRADATLSERLNTANTMAACTFGCDELFERGYIWVDESGKVRRNPHAPAATVDLDMELSRFTGRVVLGYRSAAAPFYAAHAARHQLGA